VRDVDAQRIKATAGERRQKKDIRLPSCGS
jgi:hypothetical protein